MRTISLIILLLIAGIFAAVGRPGAQEDDLVMALAPRAETLILARCSVCHSADLIAQQRLSKERWDATVEKMMHWGAEITNEEADLLIRFLSARYHPGAPQSLPPLDEEIGKAEPLSSPADAGPVVGVISRGAGLFEHNCQACHGSGAMGGMGPKLAKNPILKQEDLFWDTVLHGRGPMPAWGSALTHQDIADVHAWLLSR